MLWRFSGTWKMSENHKIEAGGVNVQLKEEDKISIFSEEMEEVSYVVDGTDRDFICLLPASGNSADGYRVLKWSDFEDTVNEASLFTVERE